MRKIYRSYKRRCEENKTSPITREAFIKALKKHKSILFYQMKLGRTEPWIITQLDDTFCLYTGITKDSVIMNIWTREECLALTGIGDENEESSGGRGT